MALLDKVTRNVDARAWQGEMPLQSRYSYGLAGQRFFREIRDHGRFMGTRCPECGYTYVPPSLYCERCFAHLDEWVEVGPAGTVVSYTALWSALDGSRLDTPDLLALIQLDGADGVMVHRLGQVELADVAIGMPVMVVLKPKKKREGSILDIVHFVPVDQ
jgi:hypothetical protein